MVRFLSSIFASLTTPARPRRTTPSPRRARLGLESLESRALPSVSPVLAVANQGAVAQQVSTVQPQLAPSSINIIHQLPPVHISYGQVPELQGLTFNLASSDGKPNHQLTIQTETYSADGSATFTGTWTGDGPNSDGTAHQVLNGTLKFDPNGGVEMSFSWANGGGSQNTFSGYVTPGTNIYAPYYLEGLVTTGSGSGSGPGQISGYGYAPLPTMYAPLPTMSAY